MVHASAEMELTGRDRSRLARARANGYLNAMCGSRQRVAEAHGFWCWRLRGPLVWFERKSPRSRYGRVRLELFTTANVLTEGGETALADIAGRLGLAGRVTISPYDGVWEDVP